MVVPRVCLVVFAAVISPPPLAHRLGSPPETCPPTPQICYDVASAILISTLIAVLFNWLRGILELSDILMRALRRDAGLVIQASGRRNRLLKYFGITLHWLIWIISLVLGIFLVAVVGSGASFVVLDAFGLA